MTPLDFDLYLVTDGEATAGRPLLDVLEAALAGGVRAVELRERDLAGGTLLGLAEEARALTQRYGARLLVNARAEVAAEARADGVHLPAALASAESVGAARAILGPGCLVGASSHGLEEAARAERAGVDFVTVGPVHPTPSKQGAGPFLGLEELTRIARSLSIPAFAIGGMGEANAAAAIHAGAHGIACIRAILSAPDPAAGAIRLRAIIRRAKGVGFPAGEGGGGR